MAESSNERMDEEEHIMDIKLLKCLNPFMSCSAINEDN